MSVERQLGNDWRRVGSGWAAQICPHATQRLENGCGGGWRGCLWGLIWCPRSRSSGLSLPQPHLQSDASRTLVGLSIEFLTWAQLRTGKCSCVQPFQGVTHAKGSALRQAGERSDTAGASSYWSRELWEGLEAVISTDLPGRRENRYAFSHCCLFRWNCWKYMWQPLGRPRSGTDSAPLVTDQVGAA